VALGKFVGKPHSDPPLPNFAKKTDRKPVAKPGRETVEESEDDMPLFSEECNYLKKSEGLGFINIDQDPSIKSSFDSISEYSQLSSESDYSSDHFEDKEKRPHVPSRRKDSLIQRKFTPFSKGGQIEEINNGGTFPKIALHQ
jgi:hypothetical protein